MEFKTDKKLLQKAIDSGCKTVAEFALYIKMQHALQLLKKKFNQ